MTAADLRRRVTELDAQIVEQKLVLNQQRLVLEELERIRTATEHELRATATYPVLTLPFEVTAHIFVQCLPLYEYEDDYNPSFSMAQQLRETAPLVLLGVCRAWKDIVLAMPKLWSTLRIRFDSFPDPVAEEPGLIEGFVDRWLGRAENCPLSLVFSLYETDNPSWPTRIRRIIRHYSHRLWHFKLGMYEEDIPKLRLRRTSFPLLESATLSTACGEGDPELIHLFSNAPRLRDFRVAREEEGPELRYLSLPWLQLTKFEGKIDNMDLFSQALNLTEAIIETLLDMDPDDDPPTTVITHSNLTSLTLYAAGGSGTLNVLEYLTLPVLQSLDISEADPASYPSLEEFLIRSSPPLLSLSVNADDISFLYWHQSLFCVAATLENLTLDDPGDEVVSSIFRRFGNNLSPLPNLRTISLVDVCRSLDFPDVVSFLHDRQRSGTLVSFRVIWCYSPFLDMEMRVMDGEFECGDIHPITGHFARMARAGMDIYIGTEYKNYAALDGHPISPQPRLE